MKIFIERLNELVEGKTVEGISEKIHLPVGYVANLLSGEQWPDGADLLCIADAYGVTTDYLLGRTEEKEPAPAAAGQAHKEISNTNNIAQSEEVVKNFTNFPPILLEFA